MLGRRRSFRVVFARSVRSLFHGVLGYRAFRRDGYRRFGALSCGFAFGGCVGRGGIVGLRVVRAAISSVGSFIRRIVVVVAVVLILIDDFLHPGFRFQVLHFPVERVLEFVGGSAKVADRLADS